MSSLILSNQPFKSTISFVFILTFHKHIRIRNRNAAACKSRWLSPQLFKEKKHGKSTEKRPRFITWTKQGLFFLLSCKNAQTINEFTFFAIICFCGDIIIIPTLWHGFNHPCFFVFFGLIWGLFVSVVSRVSKLLVRF